VRGEIRQVLFNLLANSIDAIKQSGTIHLSVEDATRNDMNGCVVEVSDNGEGIPKENLDKIFQPFFTTKKDVGTGLGLWVCREIIRKHGGSIHVQSEKGTTKFTVFLPSQLSDEMCDGDSWHSDQVAV